MKEIQLTQGKVALVDDKDFEDLNQFKWYALYDEHTGKFYARRNYYLSSKKQTSISMHRQIMGNPKNMQVDHKDMDTLNNQKDNLRICTLAENLRNRNKRSDSNVKFKGVSWHARDRVWRAQIMIDSKRVLIGCYKNDEDAAHAYDNAAKKYYGEFARTNFQGE